ncbi:MAG: DegT/DnrJ/EryC1/StrS family aminotransferase [Alphaproteobacteria bacterium]|nr:DegT/DnrJ/EryC1/StrS family aminotransferase [Alphaproteobacteria bacterium]
MSTMFPNNNKVIKLSSPWYGQEEKDAVARVLDSQVTCMGIETKLFEEELQTFLGREDINIICVNSCTAALQLSLQGIGIKPGDEVIVPTLTFISTFQAVTANGAVPIPCDVDKNTGFIDINDVKKRITKKTKCIVPVLYAGIDNNINEIYHIAHDNNIPVIEDAAHSFGNKNIIKRAGILCFSFDPIKNLSCTDGGMIVCSNNNIAERLKDIRLLGVIGDTNNRYNNKRSWDFDVKEQGWRYHMNNVCAAIGRAQLSKFNKIRELRCEYANIYLEELNSIEDIQLLPIDTVNGVPHIFPIILKSDTVDDLKNFLLQSNIGCGTQYKPNHLLKYFNKGYSLPNAEWLYRHIISIPLHPMLSKDDVYYVISKIKTFFNK